ncbi:MAG: hypothetical protein RMY34_08420 [Aulosira sp. DedQUE10]|nr:hypothetical protein [Aulosira sp. DedQUE10]
MGNLSNNKRNIFNTDKIAGSLKQVGRDYVEYIQNNYNNGEIGIVIIGLIFPLLAISGLVSTPLLITKTISESKVQAAKVPSSTSNPTLQKSLTSNLTPKISLTSNPTIQESPTPNPILEKSPTSNPTLEKSTPNIRKLSNSDGDWLEIEKGVLLGIEDIKLPNSNSQTVVIYLIAKE